MQLPTDALLQNLSLKKIQKICKNFMTTLKIQDIQDKL